MDIRQLTYFVQVAKCLNMTQAAKKLHVSQPALSKVIKNLENELDVTLIDRSSNPLTLTDAGAVLAAEAEQLIQSFDALSQSLYDTVRLNKGNIRIGIPPVIGTSFFPAIIASFREKYPGIQLTLIEEGAKTVERSLLDGTIELGIVILPVNEERITAIPIVEETYMLVVPHSHPLTKYEYVRVQDLKHESFVLLNQTFMLHDHILSVCNQAGFVPRVTFQSSQWDFLIELVGLQQGVTILPRPILTRVQSNLVKQIPIDHPTFRWRVAIVYKKQRYVSYSMKAFIEHTQEVMSSLFPSK
ncbi:LysR family transcriptional regulator [Paenibacillus agilis]|uniref:LysR family transcriptional regulator n=1 Tax=Paenibacillus agilis TaxID=3020863 RepID=A0A559IYM9_9BACL|nr:LysR family transcriptional regulator [Paenibacillus agilis]TVX92735.1 LysR family transcriptional regulator [Paenibacillus agilis]